MRDKGGIWFAGDSNQAFFIYLISLLLYAAVPRMLESSTVLRAAFVG